MEYKVHNNKENLQFEIYLGDHKAELVYRLRGDKIFLLHTWVPEELSGKGLAKALAEHALKYSLKHKYELVVYCPFVKAYISRHPNWKEELGQNP